MPESLVQLTVLNIEVLTPMQDSLPQTAIHGFGLSQQTWITPALAPALLKQADFESLHFVHHFTSHAPSRVPGGNLGSTIWVAKASEWRCAAIAFDWVQIAPGVLCVADVMGISSNVFPTDVEGCPLDDLGRLCALVAMVHKIDWQGVVLQQVDADVAGSQ